MQTLNLFGETKHTVKEASIISIDVLVQDCRSNNNMGPNILFENIGPPTKSFNSGKLPSFFLSYKSQVCYKME